MPEQALYLKWRPTLFDEVVGQEHITRTLRNSLKSGRVRHAYLFSGPRGTGKTTTARLLAKAVNCLHEDPEQRPCNTCAHCVGVNEGRFLDLIEIDAATHTGVDDVRDLRERIAFSPGEGRYRVYIIDEVHRFTGNAFDALLKTLEEPPDHAVFVLATTDIDKVPPTIKSRCLQFEFRRLSVTEVADRLEKIATSEGIQIERAALEMIARQGTGSVRDSISLLDQIVVDPGEVVTLDKARRLLGTASLGAVRDLVEALVAGDAGAGLRVVNAAVDAGADPRQFGQQVVEHLRAILLAQTAGVDMLEASETERALYARQAELVPRNALLRAVRSFNEAVNNYRGGWQPQLTLELALIESIRAPQEEVVVAAVATPATAPQAAPAGPPEEPPAPSGPPVIPLAHVQDAWDTFLRRLSELNAQAPAVVQHFQPQRVEGNVLVLATDNDLYYERLQVPEKLKVIERALRDVYKVGLRVRLAVARGTGASGTGDEEPPTGHNPLVAAAKEMGASVRRRPNGKS